MCVVGDICVQRHGCVDVWPVYVVPQFMCSDLGYTYLAGDRWPDYRWSRSTRKCREATTSCASLRDGECRLPAPPVAPPLQCRCCAAAPPCRRNLLGDSRRRRTNGRVDSCGTEWGSDHEQRELEAYLLVRTRKAATITTFRLLSWAPPRAWCDVSTGMDVPRDDPSTHQPPGGFRRYSDASSVSPQGL